jgi:hypothetical protein
MPRPTTLVIAATRDKVPGVSDRLGSGGPLLIDLPNKDSNAKFAQKLSKFGEQVALPVTKV